MYEQQINLTTEAHAAVAAFHAKAVALISASAEATRAQAELQRAGFTEYSADEILATVVSHIIEDGPHDYHGFEDTHGTWHEDIS